MADGSPGNVREKIVTLNSLQPPETEGLESAGRAGEETPASQLALARYYQIMERLRQETQEKGSNLLVTVPDRETSLVQSELARQAAADRALPAGGLEAKFGTGLAGGDWFGWMSSLLDWVDRCKAHPIVRPATTKTSVLPDVASVALVGDWGTGLYGAPKIAHQIAKTGGFDLLLHLGDVYYSGTELEEQERFLDLWPFGAGKLSRTLNSNHEMYSGGFGYFDLALPAMQQEGSYFALQNASWLLVGLDTAYVDHDLDAQQVAWLNLVIKESTAANGGKAKKLVLFSHQQLFSRLDTQGPKLRQALRHLLDAKAVTAWYWGHEHQCVIYDRHTGYNMYGRCLGNGGIPEPRKLEVLAAPSERHVGAIAWKRLSATADSPSCLALDGPNPDIAGEEEKFVPHGYMTLAFNGPSLTEKVFLSNGTELYSHVIQ